MRKKNKSNQKGREREIAYYKGMTILLTLTSQKEKQNDKQNDIFSKCWEKFVY